MRFDFRDPRKLAPFIILPLALFLILTFGIRDRSPYLQKAMEARLATRIPPAGLVSDSDLDSELPARD